MLLMRLAYILFAAVLSLSAGSAIFPLLTSTHRDGDVQGIVVVLKSAKELATKQAVTQVGFATGGATVQLSNGKQVVESGLPLGGYAPTALRTTVYAPDVGLWVEPTGSTVFAQQTLPVTITITSQGAFGVSAGLIGSLASLPTCNEIALGYPAGSSMPLSATKVSCATGTVEDADSP